MPSRALVWLSATSVFALGAALAFAGCTLARDGSLTQNCTSIAECEDANPCTTDDCSTAGVCQHVSLPDQVLADELQVAADCKRLSCSAGALVAVEDASDLADDANDCTLDSCSAGAPSHAPKNPNESCVDGGGHAGLCVALASDPAGIACQTLCTAADAGEKCDDQNDCTLDSCDLSTGTCVHAPLNGTPAPDQQAGDCTVLLCLDGAATPVVDDSDVPAPPNECAVTACNEGTVSMTPVAMGKPCGIDGGEVCNGDPVSPACGECNLASDCTALPPDDECQARACNNHLCSQTFTAIDTPLAVQLVGDCKMRVCDGAGGTKNNVLGSDEPNDQNACTQDLCDAQGNPSNPPEPSGTGCGNGGVCDGNGVCGCASDFACPADSFCRNYSCNLANHTCVFAVTNPNVALPGQTPHDCQELRCTAQGDVASVPVDDPPASDGNECTLELCNAGVPVVTNAALNAPCNTNQFCDGAGQCVACNANDQCDSKGCGCSVCSAHVCNALPPGTVASCQTAGDCQTQQCAAGGTTTGVVNTQDIPIDNQQCTLDQCAANGTPSNPAAAAGTACSENGGQVCDGAKHCVECLNASHCQFGQSCDGATHTCKWPQGAGCGTDSECTTNHCVDGVCCADACAGTCRSCNQLLSLGSCANIGTDQTPDAECNNSGLSCAAGQCKKINGQACNASSECVSNHCTDGVCCNVTCGAGCWACAQSKTGVADGTCSVINWGTDPNDDCGGHQCCYVGVCGGNSC